VRFKINVSDTFQEGHLVHIEHFVPHSTWLSHLLMSWNEAKLMTLPKSGTLCSHRIHIQLDDGQTMWEIYTKNSLKAYWWRRPLSLFLVQSEWLSTNIKLTLHKTLVICIIMLAHPVNLWQIPISWNFSGYNMRLCISLVSSKTHTGPWFAHGFQTFIPTWLYSKTEQALSRSHIKSWVHMSAILDKEKLNTENITGSNLAAVWHMTIWVTRLPLLHELLRTGNNLLFWTWTEEHIYEGKWWSRVWGAVKWLLCVNLPNPSGCTKPWDLLSL
jgi:hypothetical protein